MAGGLVETALQQVTIIFLHPDERKVAGQAEFDGVGAFRQTNNRLEPGFIDFVGKQGLEIALQSRPQAVGQGFGGHFRKGSKGLDIHTEEKEAFLSQREPGIARGTRIRNSLSALNLYSVKMKKRGNKDSYIIDD